MIFKELFVIVILVFRIECITNNKNEAGISLPVESQLTKPENRKPDKFVLIGHSNDPESSKLTSLNENGGTIDRNMRTTRKFYPSREDFYHKNYNNLIDENSKEVETETEESHSNVSFLNPRSGYSPYAGAYGGFPAQPATRPGYYGGHGYSFGNGYSASGGLGFLGSGFGLGLGSLHLLDPLLLLATLSFVLFLVNSVITLVERIRIGGHSGGIIAARREFFARESPETHPHLSQEIFNDMEQFFHQLIQDYEMKIHGNKTKEN